MNPQQFATYMSQNQVHNPNPFVALPRDLPLSVPPQQSVPPQSVPPQSVPQHQGVPPQSVPQHHGVSMAKPQGAIGKKKKSSPKSESAMRISERVKKQLKEHNKHAPTDMKTQLELLYVQVKNLQRVADTSLRRIHVNELEEKHHRESILKEYDTLRQAMMADHENVRRAIETLAKHSIWSRSHVKEHNKVIYDFRALVDNYTNDTFEDYLNERCLKKFNEMADKILQETDMTSEDIAEIARGLGLDNEVTQTQIEEGQDADILQWDFDDVISLLKGEGDVASVD